VAVNNSIKIGPLGFLLQMSLVKENIMKRPVYAKYSSLATFRKTWRVLWIHYAHPRSRKLFVLTTVHGITFRKSVISISTPVTSSNQAKKKPC